MLVYLIMISIIIALFLVPELETTQRAYVNKRNTKNKKVLAWMVFCVLGFVAAFRYGVGADFYAYFKTKNITSNFLSNILARF